MDLQCQGITGRTNPRGHFCERRDDVDGLTQMRGQSRRFWPILDGDCIRAGKLRQAVWSLSCTLQSLSVFQASLILCCRSWVLRKPTDSLDDEGECVIVMLWSVLANFSQRRSRIESACEDCRLCSSKRASGEGEILCCLTLPFACSCLVFSRQPRPLSSFARHLTTLLYTERARVVLIIHYPILPKTLKETYVVSKAVYCGKAVI